MVTLIFSSWRSSTLSSLSRRATKTGKATFLPVPCFCLASGMVSAMVMQIERLRSERGPLEALHTLLTPERVTRRVSCLRTGRTGAFDKDDTKAVFRQPEGGGDEVAHPTRKAEEQTINRMACIIFMLLFRDRVEDATHQGRFSHFLSCFLDSRNIFMPS